MTYAYSIPAQTSAARWQHAVNVQQSKQSSAILSDRRMHPRQFVSRIAVAAWQLALHFGKRTTIHGLDRLLVARASRSERFIWLSTFISAFLGAVYVCLILSKRYSEGHFQTVVDSTRYPVYRIPFPVTTICNLNRLNWQRIEAAKQRFLPGETDGRRLQLFEQIVASYDDISFGHFEAFGMLKHAPLADLNHVNFSLVVEFMTWRCDEMLTACYWRNYPYNCCDIFSLRRSFQGLCLAFNSLETAEGRRMKLLDPLWPWRTGNAGPKKGLNVRVLLNPEKQYPNSTIERGISLMFTEPFVWHKEVTMIPARTQTVVGVEPVIYFYDNDTRTVSSDQRMCVFEDERNSRDFKSLNGYVYMIENCMSQCYQEYLVRYCNCTVDLFFPPAEYRSCSATDLPCLAQNNEYFQYSHEPGEEEFVHNQYQGMVCKCFRNCYSLNYIPDVRPTFLPSEIYHNSSYIDLDVHFRFETMIVYRTSLVFGWVDLLVSFGGIAGLFLGCSLISGMELAYFVCIEVPTFIIVGLRQKWQQRNMQFQEDNSAYHWGRRRFNIQNQLEQYIMQVTAKQTNQSATTNNWEQFDWTPNKVVINK